jgi:prepilin-type processing-associated H-X9-DG protein
MMKTKREFRCGLPRGAFTLLELVLCVLVCGLMASIFVSAASRVRARSQRIKCADNLKTIGLGFKTWSLDDNGRFPTNQPPGLASTYFHYLSSELANPKVLICPADVRRAAIDLRKGLSNTNLSYFVGLDAVDKFPQMFLSGDRNLTNGPLPPDRILLLDTNFPASWTRELHRGMGNIALADGSVQQYSNHGLNEALRSGSCSNRLAIP